MRDKQEIGWTKKINLRLKKKSATNQQIGGETKWYVWKSQQLAL